MNLNNQSLCGIYLDKTIIDKSNMSYFKEFLYRKTYKNYLMSHVVNEVDKERKEYKKEFREEMYKINPLEKSSNILSEIDNRYKGVILSVPLSLINGPQKLDLTNIKLRENRIITPEEKSQLKIATVTKIKKFFDKQLFGLIYVIKDMRRGIICLYEFYINDKIINIELPFNRTPYKSDIIASSFSIFFPSNIKQTFDSPSPLKEQLSFNDSFNESTSIELGQNINYYGWGLYILETIMNTFIIDPFDINIWFGIDINSSKRGELWSDILIKIFIDHSFANPYFSTKDPMNIDYDYNFIGLISKNQLKFTSIEDRKNVYNRLLYLYDQNINKCININNEFENGKRVYFIYDGMWKSGKIINSLVIKYSIIGDDKIIYNNIDKDDIHSFCICNAQFKFDEQTILWLLRLPFGTTTVNISDKDDSFTLTQKEFSGTFIFKNVKCNNKLEIGGYYKFLNKEDGYIYEGVLRYLDLVEKSAIFENISLGRKIININDIILDEDCNYDSKNYLWEVTLDKRSLTSRGKKFEDLEDIINNIKHTCETNNTNIINENISKIKTLESTLINIDIINEIQQYYNKNIHEINQQAFNKIINIIKESDKSKYKYVLSGKEASTEISEGIANFHTHPYECYIENKCTIGFPSGSDFTGFIYSYYNFSSIFHAVITIEGIYVLSFKEDFLKEYNPKILLPILERIKISFEFFKNKFTSGEEFCQFINKYSYIDKDFVSWHNKFIEQQNKTYNIGDNIIFFNDKGDIFEGQIIRIANPNDFDIQYSYQGSMFVLNTSISQINHNNSFYYNIIKDTELNTKIKEDPSLTNLILLIFDCQFKTWEQLVQYPNFNIFNISYVQQFNQCFLNSDTIKIILKLYTYKNNFFYSQKFLPIKQIQLPSLFEEMEIEEDNF